jgi:hypothetical protein
MFSLSGFLFFSTETFPLTFSLLTHIESSFFFQPTTVALIWVIIYSSDWLMNYWGTCLYHKQVKKYCLFEKGYNVKQISEEELGHPLELFLRYLGELIITTFALWLLLYECRLHSSWQFYEFFCGFFILLEACIHFRHIRNVTLFSLIKPETGFYGSLAIPRWLSLRTAFIEHGVLGLGFLIVFLFDSNNYFVLGGALSSFIALLYNFNLSERLKRKFLSNNPEISGLKESLKEQKLIS